MAELILVSQHEHQLRSLVETALQNEKRLLEAAIRRTQRRLQEFEARYNLPSAELARRFEQDEMEETVELAEWIGQYRLLQRLQEKTAILAEVRFAN